MKPKKLLALLLSLAILASALSVSVFAEGEKLYKDGAYTGESTVEADQFNDFDSYNIKVNVVIESGKITSVAFSDDCNIDSDNLTYANRAMNGRGSQAGVAAQIIAANSADNIDVVSTATCTSTAIQEAVKNVLDGVTVTPDEEIEYVLMNIPYDKFYEADLNNSVPVDAVTSATLNKTRTGSLVGGSYHINSDGTDITGITFPVKVSDASVLAEYVQVTDSDSVDITVTNRGNTTTTTYSGKDALFQNPSYAYYVLSEAPDYYKELTVNADGYLSFGKTVGSVQTLSEATAELSTETSYGDYLLSVDGLPSINTVYAVTLSTAQGNDYGLRHLENIWRNTELAWCTGFTTSVHNCPTSSDHYVAMMGQTINKVTYYTDGGIYVIPVNIYVPVTLGDIVSVADSSSGDGTTDVTFSKALPADFDAEYGVEGLDSSYSNGKLSYTNAAPGSYTLTVSDKSGKYVDITSNFVLSTTDMPAAYNDNDESPALVAAEGFTAEQFNAYLEAITSVSVNGASYAASGRNSVAIIKSDGTIDLSTTPFAEYGDYSIVVSATGYPDLSFSLTREAPAPTPDTPDNPEDNPGQTDVSNNSDNITDTVKTGDELNLVLLLGLLFVSGSVLTSLVLIRRKLQKK